MTYAVIANGNDVLVCVVRKKMTQVRLKVFPSGEVRLSVPIDTPDEWICSFINSKQKWIEERLQNFAKTKAIEKEEHIQSGTSTRILGRQLTIRVVPSSQKRIAREDSILTVLTTASDQMAIDRQFNNWWQKTAKMYYQEVVDRLFPVIGKYGVEKPVVSVLKMKTLWGSCSRQHNKINLNFYLYKAPSPCVEYVILHEMAHFLYPHHDKDFYDFISIHMPDWKERKKQLDYEIVLGI